VINKPMDEKRWKRSAIRSMRRSRTATRALLSMLTPGEIRRPRTQEKWSIHDTLAHIVAWEEVAARRLESIRQKKYERLRFYDDMADTDAFNARAVARFRPLSFSALWKRAGEVRAGLIAALRALPDDELENEQHRFTVVQWLPEFSWTHERDHRKRIRKIIRTWNKLR